MKNAKFHLLLLAPLVCLGIITTTPTQGAQAATNNTTTQVITNSDDESVVTSNPDSTISNSDETSSGSSETEDTATDESDQVTIYDRNGNVVLPTNVMPGIEPRATVQPTTLKWLKKGESYLSNAFSGSGMRYSGYIFGLNGSSKAEISLSKGGFTAYVTASPDPGFLTAIYNMPLSGSPYTLNGGPYFYFGVNNPVKGQTYAVKAK